MSLPYQNATSGDKALGDIQKILRGFGCSRFASGDDFDAGEVFVQFEHRGRRIHMVASAKGYAKAWLRENPWTSRRRSTKSQWEAEALRIGSIAVYSILRDWVKAQVTVIETGILSFEGAFLGHMVLPSGKTTTEYLVDQELLRIEAKEGES